MPERPSSISRSEWRRQQRLAKKRKSGFSQSKRNLLIGIGAVAGAAAVGGVGYILKTGEPLQPSPDILALEKIKSELERLNGLLNKQPNKITEAAPLIGNLATQYFCQEMNSLLSTTGYQPSNYEGKILYENNQDYVKTKEEESGCTITPSYDDEFGHVNVEFNVLHVNTEAVLKDEQGGPHPYPAYLLFGSVIHELHHVSTATVKLATPQNFFDQGLNRNYEVIGKRGLSLLAVDPEYAKKGRICYRTYRSQLEEAIVQHSTDLMLRKLGFNVDPNPQYQNWINNYQRGVLTPLFNGDHRLLLSHQQRSQDVDFFTAVGTRLPNVPPTQAAAFGERAVFRVIVQGLPPL